MLHHVEFCVGDLARSTRFWTPLLERLGYETERWSGGVTFVAGTSDPYLTLVPAPREHATAGYHRRRIGLNHLACQAASRRHLDDIRAWLAAEGRPLLHDDRFPFATGPGYYADFCENPDRIEAEVKAPNQDDPALD